LSFFEELAQATAADAAALTDVPQIADALAGRISRETYLAFLREAYHHVRHTAPLMRAAHARLDADHAPFRQALEAYAAEEAGHEAWILDDIRRAGGDWTAARDGAPRPATRALVDYAYGVVQRGNPMGLFGMVYVLEGTSVRLASRGAHAVAASLGLGPECFSYLRSHGALDLTHMAFFRELMSGVEQAGDRAAIVDTAQAVFRLYADLFRAIPHERDPAHAV
jgi:hypothetical protein